MIEYMKKHSGDFEVVGIFLLVILALGGFFALVIGAENAAEEAKNARIESKSEFLASDRFSDVDIEVFEWERRVEYLFPAGSEDYDVFLIDTVSGELMRLNVYDASVNDKYLVEVQDL